MKVRDLLKDLEFHDESETEDELWLQRDLTPGESVVVHWADENEHCGVFLQQGNDLDRITLGASSDPEQIRKTALLAIQFVHMLRTIIPYCPDDSTSAADSRAAQPEK
jgi:hypothetical protein